MTKDQGIELKYRFKKTAVLVVISYLFAFIAYEFGMPAIESTGHIGATSYVLCCISFFFLMWSYWELPHPSQFKD